MMCCLRLSAPINMGNVCLETRFFGSDDTGPLEEHPSLKNLSPFLSDVFVINSLLRRIE